MAKDYRRVPPPRSSQKRRQNRSCIWWFLLGALVGGFATHLYWMRHAKTLASATPEVQAPPAGQPAREPPTFEFQKLLNDTKVEIGGSEPPPPPPAPRPQPPEPLDPNAAIPEDTKPAPAGSGSYLVQVASFKRAADAERLKAELALLGIVTSVQAVTVASGEVYHRVRTGPYSDRKSVDEVRALLKRNGKDSMTISIK